MAWFDRTLADPTCLHLVASGPDGTPVGQVRFQPFGDDALEVGVVVDPGHRGQGRAAPLVLAGARLAFVQTEAEAVHAWIRADDVRSGAAFAAAGFS